MAIETEQLKLRKKLDYLHVISEGKLSIYSNYLTEIDYLRQGLTTSGLQAFADLLNWELTTVAKAVGTTKRTLIRNKAKRLNKQVSENALDVARLSTFGMKYFGSVNDWNLWLDTHKAEFNNQPPRSFINSIRGRELIKEAINALKFNFT